MEVPIKTTSSETDYPVHMVSRLGLNKILQRLIGAWCNINYQLSDRISRNCTNDLLAPGAADFGLVNSAGQSASVLAVSARWAPGFQQAVVEVIRSGEIARSNVDLNEQDEKGYSAAMIAAEGGYLETFKLLIDVGADINLQNKHGQTVMELFNTNHDSEEFEKLLLKNTHLKRTQHQAVQHNAADFVHTLIGRGSDLM
ncbi:hypothetical protein DVH24_033789 [Malus domestica]|uniref:Uncharacterized protein n=1 Tax=Malus domestica TaxID=3750 RepID=A0A498HSX9_MALDO|nr:hypothetical protein DVH24_033789 [Malus domestica]